MFFLTETTNAHKRYWVKFADDSKLYSINKYDLQKTLDNFSNFVYDRNIKLALEKCRHLIISNKSSDTTFELNNSKIERCTMVKTLESTFLLHLNGKVILI